MCRPKVSWKASPSHRSGSFENSIVVSPPLQRLRSVRNAEHPGLRRRIGLRPVTVSKLFTLLMERAHEKLRQSVNGIEPFTLGRSL